MTTETKLADLPAKWRAHADSDPASGGATSGGMRVGLRSCADELEAALARQASDLSAAQADDWYARAVAAEKLSVPHGYKLVRDSETQAAPPAQAVDLEQFRGCVLEARAVHQQNADNWSGRGLEARYLEYVAECDRLLALIDSQRGRSNG